jgi:protease-4
MDNNDIPPLSTPPGPPPLPAAPPLMVAPAPSRPPRRGRGWMIFALLLLVLLGISVLFNLGHFFEKIISVGGMQSHRTGGPRLEEVVLEDNGGNSKIAVISVEGIITSRMLDQSGFNMVDVIKAQLKRAEEDHKVEAVILKVDSPGGEVLASDDISRAIAEFQEEKDEKGEKHAGKPVIASMGGLAASGGYYVSAPCRLIVANELTITGSIGVIMSTWNYRGLMDKVGVRPLTFKSGKFKDMLSGSRNPDEIPADERAMVQSLIDETYGKFKSVVDKGRGQAADKNKKEKHEYRALVENWRDYADGRILSGKEARELGFVDQLGDFDKAVKEAADIAGVSKYNLVEYRLHYDLGDFLRLFGKSDAHGVKVDLGLEMPKLEAGRLYFLSPTYLH